MIKVWDYKKEYQLLRDDILEAVDNVFKSGVLIFGPNVEEFEKKFSTYHDSEFGIGVGNCTDAITISLKALDITSDSEVIFFICWRIAGKGISPAKAKGFGIQ